MKYDITTKAAPKMPNLGKGTECIKLLTGQTSKDMHEPVVPLLFPPLAAHVCGAEFQYPDNTWKEVCGIMANIVADSGDNKGQLTPLVEALCRDFRLHDKGVTDELVEWLVYHDIWSKMQIFSDMLNGKDADRDEPGERLFLQLKELLPSLQHHQLPPSCKDFSDYYLSVR